MFECLIPEVINTFADNDESEHAFLMRLQAADIRLRKNYATNGAVDSGPYAEPILRAAYLFRYLGHYALQLGDLLQDLQDTAARDVLAKPTLNLAALCGGPCPEAITLATLHQQAGGRAFNATVLDLHARAWSDCWPITERIIADYSGHPHAVVRGISNNIFGILIPRRERDALTDANVFTCMNCLNELVGVNTTGLRRGLKQRLALLSPGTLVLASDQANYPDCASGLQILHQLLEGIGADVLLADLDPSNPHRAENRFELPDRIGWLYTKDNANLFRIHVRQLRLAAILR